MDDYSYFKVIKQIEFQNSFFPIKEYLLMVGNNPVCSIQAVKKKS